MKTYTITAKTSNDSISNTLCIYTEDNKIWIGYENCEDRGFTTYETQDLICVLQKCIEKLERKSVS